jgi:hypothetical protein
VQLVMSFHRQSTATKKMGPCRRVPARARESTDSKGSEEAVSRILCPLGRRPFILAVRRRTAPAANPKASPAEAGCGDGRSLAFLLGLAPHGVYRASTVTDEAVRSYRTLSPLPPSRARRRSALCGTFPRVAAAGRYPACCPSGVRTFLCRSWSSADARLLRSLPVYDDVGPDVHERLWWNRAAK